MYSIRLPSAFSRAWVPSVVCQYFRHTTGRIKVYQAADLSTFLLRPVCFRPTSCTSAMMELMPCALTPACGVASMPIHPGCHRPFYHSVVLRSITSAVVGFALLFKDSFLAIISLDPTASVCLTQSVITLRPFALCFTSWRVLVVCGR